MKNVKTIERRPSAAAKRGQTGEAYVYHWPSPEAPSRYMLRLPRVPGKGGKLVRRELRYPHTPEGLADAVQDRDDYLAELADQDRVALATGHRTYPATVSELCSRYLELPKTMSRASFRDIEKVVGRISEHFGPMLVRSVTAEDCTELLEKQALEGYSESSVKKTRAYMHAVFNFARARKQLASVEWMQDVETPTDYKTVQLPRVILTDEQFGQLVECEDVDFRLRLMCVLSRTVGGMRTQELHVLLWSSLNWNAPHSGDPTRKGTLWVRRPKTERKNGAPEKPHDVPPDALRWLKEWWLMQGKPKGDVPMFPGEDGEVIPVRTVSYARPLRRALKLAGVEDESVLKASKASLPVDFHGFRRAFCTGMGGEADERKGMRLAGHKNAKTHERYVMLAQPMAVPDHVLPRIPAPARRARHGGASE